MPHSIPQPRHSEKGLRDAAKLHPKTLIDNGMGFAYNNVINDVEFDIKKGMT